MMPIPIDYEVLRVLWWFLLGVLLIGFAITDGFDLGILTLLPIIGKTDEERRIMLNTIGPVWEGNQVWFILGGGAIFAAWPMIYAVSFSGFYLAMLVVLLALILRPVGFKYRSKVKSPTWRTTWDILLFIGGVVPALIFGVALGNVLQGVPFQLDTSLRIFYTGTFWQLLNPFAIGCGLVSVFMLTMHGGVYLACKTEGPLRARAARASEIAALIYVVLFVGIGYFITHLDGYMFAQPVVHDGVSNPLNKKVIVEAGAWLTNFALYPWLWSLPILAVVSALLTVVTVAVRSKWAFIPSSIVQFTTIATLGVSMFPFILPSSSNPSMSLTVWDASSSQTTLFIMLIATVIFMPIILLYTSWVYRILRGKITADFLKEQGDSAY